MANADRIIELLHEARTRHVGAEREQFLAGACRGDGALKEQIDSLLEAEAEAGDSGSFLQHRAVLRPPLLPAAKPGDRIGRYKLLEQIGEGGCGVVFMAEQEEPVRRRVALKVIKLGMDTESVIARFEAERQALALMDHPNIARVLDAGATDAGRPYFVMELVRGARITDYCDGNALTTAERLRLFLQVCQAIQHAHQKGIIHRDIKPSNILVTVNEPGGPGCPKAIDFGIAKATNNQRLADRTVFTVFEQFIGTPAYMSPEQAMMTSLDVDTRTDVYALGVLLYELLTGRTPFDGEAMLRSGVDEMRRIIREEEPVRPSTRLSTLGGSDLAAVARQRQAEPVRLGTLLRGDLDWIVMRCLEKDRARRYATVSALAADVECHLLDEPVSARPPSAAYRFQKLVHRNRLAFAAGAVVFLTLVAGIGLSSWQAAVATRARNDSLRAQLEVAGKARVAQQERDKAKAAQARAEAARADAEAIATFLSEVFQSPDPTRTGRIRSVPELLGAAAVRLETGLASQPARRAMLQATLGATYHSLGMFREAIVLQEKAQAYYRGTLGEEHAETIKAMGNLADSCSFAGRVDEALELRKETLRLSTGVNGREDPRTIQAMVRLAESHLDAARSDPGKSGEATRLLEAALPLCRKVHGPEAPETLWAMHQLSNAQSLAGRHDQARSLLEQVLALSRRVNGPRHPATLWAMQDVANHYRLAGRDGEARLLREERLALSREANGPDHPNTLIAMDHLADSLAAVGLRTEAAKLWSEALSISRRVMGFEEPLTRRLANNLADSHLATGRFSEGLAVLSDATLKDPSDTETILKLGTLQLWLGMEADYVSTCRRVLQWATDTKPSAGTENAAKLLSLRSSGDPSFREGALNLARGAVTTEMPPLALPWFRLTLAMAEYRSGHYAAASEALVQPIRAAASADGDTRRRLGGTAAFYQAMSRFRQGDQTEARQLFHRAAGDMKPVPMDESQPLAGDATYEDIILWLAYREARALIEPAGQPEAR